MGKAYTKLASKVLINAPTGQINYNLKRALIRHNSAPISMVGTTQLEGKKRANAKKQT
jgi:hypothetical protein